MNLPRSAMLTFWIVLDLSRLEFISANPDKALKDLTTIRADGALGQALFGNIWPPHTDEVVAAGLTFILAG